LVEGRFVHFSTDNVVNVRKHLLKLCNNQFGAIFDVAFDHYKPNLIKAGMIL